MQNRISTHIRANVIGYIALFCLAMGGTAYALPGSNTVFTDDIVNGQVKAVDVGTGAVTSAKIKDGQVKGLDLGLGAVTGAKIKDGSVTGADVADNSLKGSDVDELALNLGVLQKRISGGCGSGQAIRQVAQDGTVTCEPTGGGGSPTGPAGGDLTGTYPDPQIADSAVTVGKLGFDPATQAELDALASPGTINQAGNPVDWTKLKSVPGEFADGSDSTGNDWHLGGNAGTSASDFIGTTDNTPLNVHVDNARALRLEPASNGIDQSPNLIGGSADNTATAGAYAATIAGGGPRNPSDPATANRVTDSLGTVVGGGSNQAGDGAGTVVDKPFAFVGGGSDNTAAGSWATVSGGLSNTAGDGATVGGGDNNDAGGLRATVAGGLVNQASGFAATVPGGGFNTSQGDYSLAAGQGAQANHNGAFVWADSSPFLFQSTAQDQFNVRSTGGARLVSGINGSGSPTSGLEMPAGVSGWSTLVNGQSFDIGVNGARAFRISPASDGTNQSPNVIGGSDDNSVTNGVYGATIAGGNRALPANPSTANRVTDHQGTVGGGANNQAGDGAGFLDDRAAATVSGGRGNTASGTGATVSGGIGNFATGSQAMVPGGFSNTAQGNVSFAAGRDAKALHDGAFVWADSTTVGGFGVNFSSTAANEFSVRATGGARFVSGVNPATGDPNAGVQLAPGGGSWSSLSDETSKRAIRPASGRKVLRKLASVPVSTWSYRAQDDSIRHVGPMAQDFYRAFRVGEDRRHIASVDADGVALAAIKGLSRELRMERRRRHKQERRLDRLEARVAALEREGGR